MMARQPRGSVVLNTEGDIYGTASIIGSRRGGSNAFGCVRGQEGRGTLQSFTISPATQTPVTRSETWCSARAAIFLE